MKEEILSQLPPVREKRKKSADPPVLQEGADPWVATYSDMMSLLLTFFILLFSVSEIQSSKVYEVLLGFEEYFNVSSMKLGYYSQQISSSGDPGFLGESKNRLRFMGNRGRTPALKIVAEKIDHFASLVKKDNHQTIVIPGLILFSPGKAAIREEAIPTLLRVAARLKQKTKEIKIVGHTSSIPLDPDADARDHFSLGFLRAMAVGRFLNGQYGDLSILSEEYRKKFPDIPAGVGNLRMNQFLISSRGWSDPNSMRENLWEDVALDDRVELIFYSEGQED